MRELVHPVTVTLQLGATETRSEHVTEIRLRRRIKGRDLRVLDDFTGETAKLLALVGRLSGQPIAVIEAISLSLSSP